MVKILPVLSPVVLFLFPSHLCLLAQLLVMMMMMMTMIQRMTFGNFLPLEGGIRGRYATESRHRVVCQEGEECELVTLQEARSAFPCVLLLCRFTAADMYSTVLYFLWLACMPKRCGFRKKKKQNWGWRDWWSARAGFYILYCNTSTVTKKVGEIVFQFWNDSTCTHSP